MDADQKTKLQQRVDNIGNFWIESLHRDNSIPRDFRPWTSMLSPSALYACSLPLRKKIGIKAPEAKWMNIKRWTTSTPSGINLPPGVYYSVKRKEEYVPIPTPKLEKKEFILLMFPFGNVWSQKAPGVPIDEDWIWSESEGMTILEALMRKDAARPIPGYFKSCHDYMIANPDQIGIHLKRKRKTSPGL